MVNFDASSPAAGTVSPDGRDMTVIVETFLHSAPQCIRQDPPTWTVAPRQTVTIALPAGVADGTFDMWRSCTGWRYPADDDSFLVKQAPVAVSSGHITFRIQADYLPG